MAKGARKNGSKYKEEKLVLGLDIKCPLAGGWREMAQIMYTHVKMINLKEKVSSKNVLKA